MESQPNNAPIDLTKNEKKPAKKYVPKKRENGGRR